MSLIPDRYPRHDPIRPGLTPAICIGVFDLGTQKVNVKGHDKLQRKVHLLFEIPSETYEVDGKKVPRTISRRYTFSYDTRSHLYRDLSSWRGKELDANECSEFDLVSVLRAPCTLNIIHRRGEDNGELYANVDSVLPKPTDPLPEPVNPVVSYSIKDNGEAIPEDVPEHIKAKIRASVEFERFNKRDEVDQDSTMDGKYFTPPDATPESSDEDLPF